MPPRPDLSFAGLDESVFKSAVRKTTTSVPETKTSISKTSKDIVEKPKTVRHSAPIIEEWDTNNNNNNSVFRPKSNQTKPKFTNINFVKSGENVKSVNKENTHRQVEYPRKSQTVVTKSGQVLVNAAKQSSPRAAISISTARPVNTDVPKPKVHDALPTTYPYFQTHSPVKKPINKRTTVTDINVNKKINTAKGNPQYTLLDQGIFDSVCSRHMTGNKSFLTDYQEIDGGFVAFGGSPKGGKIIGKCKIRTGKLDFEDVYFVKELEFNLFPVSQMCDKKNNVLFTKTECLVLSFDFKLLDESQVLLKVPRQNNMYSFDLKNVIPSGARTMLVDSFLPTTFWAGAVNTACYVQNRVLVTKPHNKTPYELLHGRPPSISFMRSFRCPVTILNTLDPLGKFDGKADEGFLVGYSINSKAFRVFNTRTRKVEENLHITFLENKPNVAGSGPDWLFDIDLLTNSMNYEPVTAGNQTNGNAGIKDNIDAVPTQQYILLPLLSDSLQSSEDAVVDDAGKNTTEELANKGERNGQEKEGGASNKKGDHNVQVLRAELDKLLVQQKEAYANSTNRVSTVSPSVNVTGGAYDDEDVGAEADLNNLETTMNVSPIPTTRIHKDHPKDQINGDINSAT
ncbi:ribonuclease H-like domain-containing protein [Tanacetum coccineum]|uniref:Ribonuclease H-like domain-containing protein n=1 Tax=Tanacetum coccineum TaxID=301880 RepID=A0ABQ5EZP9_9ASTR